MATPGKPCTPDHLGWVAEGRDSFLYRVERVGSVEEGGLRPCYTHHRGVVTIYERLLQAFRY